MINRIKLLVATAAGLAVLATGASAAEFSVSPAGRVNATSGSLTFASGETRISCAVTLELELLAGPIAKVEGTAVGRVTGVRWNSCSGAVVEGVLGLPWSVQYRSINGTLPSGVTSVNLTIVNARFRLLGFFGTTDCLYAGNAGSIMTTTLVRGTTGTYTSSTIRSDERTTQSLNAERSTFGCPGTGSMAGTFTLATTQTITRT